MAICVLPFSLNFGDFEILVIYNLDFGDFNFGDVLLGPKNHQNPGITVVGMILQLNRNSKVIIFELLNSYLDKQTLLYNSKFDLRGQERLEFNTRSVRNDNLIIDFFSITACPAGQIPNAANTD